MRFETLPISELIDEISMGPFGSNIKVECFVDEGIPVLNGSNLEGYELKEDSFRYVTEEKADSLNKANAYRGDIVITHRGTLGQIVFIPQTSKYDRYVISQSQFRVRCNHMILPEYMVYYFHQTFQKIEIEIPDIPSQKRIIAILQTIHDKIAINTKINENLEQQAQALYRQVFVNADDNQSATIADISLNVTDGVHNTVKDDPEGNYLLLSCKNIKGGSLSIGSSERHINKETFDKLRKRTQLAKGDILISSVGTIGETLMLNTEPKNYEFQRSVAMIKPDTKIVSSAYVYESLLYKKAELINAAHGAVQQCLFISDICEFPIDIPSKVKLDMFNSAVIPMFDIITAKYEENQRLAALRDTLLPKLMSGELDVSQVQI